MHFHDPLGFSLDPPPASPGDPVMARSAAIGEAARKLGFSTFGGLAGHVQALPYGRTLRSDDPLAVLREGRGTSSSKHRLLATVAQGCGHFEVMLTVGIYSMSEANTPGVGAVLTAASLTSIPEARCYLTIDHQRFDFTGGPRGSISPFASLSAEYFLAPDTLAERKASLHRQVLARWAETQGLAVETAWSIREACIAALAPPRP